MNTLSKIEMSASKLEHGKLYIWSLPHGEKKVVWLTPDRDGLAEYDSMGEDEEDWWFFQDDLVGELYGPFSLAV